MKRNRAGTEAFSVLQDEVMPLTFSTSGYKN